MNAKEYIIKKIDQIISKFKDIKVLYQYDKNEYSHYIKIIPSKTYKANQDYIKFETEFILDFINKFPNEEIIFITENDLIDIDPNKITYIKVGDFFKDKITSNVYDRNFDNKISIDLQINIDINENNLSLLFEIFNTFHERIKDNLYNDRINPLSSKPILIQTDDKFPLAA